MQLRLGWLKKLVPLQQAFEEELHKKANAKKRSYDETDGNAFDFDEDVAATASQEEQLKDRTGRNRKDLKRGNPTRGNHYRWDQNLGYKPVMSRSSRPGGLFWITRRRRTPSRGPEGAHLARASRTVASGTVAAGSGDVFEQSAPYQPLRKGAGRDGERSDLNGVRIAPRGGLSPAARSSQPRLGKREGRRVEAFVCRGG